MIGNMALYTSQLAGELCVLRQSMGLYWLALSLVFVVLAIYYFKQLKGRAEKPVSR